MNIKHKITWGITLLLVLFGLIPSCSFLTSFDDDKPKEIEINSLTLGRTSLDTQIGSMEYVSLSVKPADQQKNIKLDWNYDNSIIDCDTSSNWGVTIKGLKEGKTVLRCSYGGIDASCIVTVKGTVENIETSTEPYIYSNYSILQTSPGVSEKVFVSLYGGDASDIDGYAWTIDTPSVASIQPTGQYCIITAKDSGYARIKVTHGKAAYPYYIGVYVFADPTKVSYITTSSNIVTMNKDDDEKNITVSLVNGKDSSRDEQFSWEILTENNSDSPINLSWNGNNAVITPKDGGSCTLRISHPDAAYPLDILCRVITVVKNVYIQPDNTVITLTGENEQTVTNKLMNTDNSEYSYDGFTYTLDDYNVAEIVASIGNQVTLKGISNGSCKLLISHEKAAYSREVLVISNGQIKDAVDASCYITTSQNYIRTKVGASGQTINISLKGGDDGDESEFAWTVKSTAADGTSDKVINLETASGSVFHTASRAADATYAYGTAFMEPVSEGTAVITITHPKILYSTEILVKVLPETAIVEEQLYFSGSGLVKMLNGQSQEYRVELKGSNKKPSDDNSIEWKCDSQYLSLTANANIATITAPELGTGSTISYITISHPNADSEKKILVMTADDIETLNSMKALYSDKTYYNIENGTTASCNVNAVGFEENYDFSTMSWTVKDKSILQIEKSINSPLVCKMTGLKSGSTTITASIAGTSCDFEVTVYPKGTVAILPDVYFTTSQNVISLSGSGKEAKAYITAVNLPSSEYSNIEWTSSNPQIASVIGNGTSANISAMQEGETVLSVNHKDSQNTLKIYVRIGSEYVMEDKPVIYIGASDVITLIKGDENKQLTAYLANYAEEDKGSFHFEIDNHETAEITAQSVNGIAYIKPLNSGQAVITIRNSLTSITKQVLVLVGNSVEELAGYVYLTTSTNVVSVGEGNTKSVSVSVKNSSSPILDGYTWISSNPAIVDVTSSGSSAILTGNGIGTAMITVKNKACHYPLTIIAQCVDPVAASQNPYIQLSSSVLTLNVSLNYTSVTADLIGGTSDDYSDFIWEVEDKSVCAVYGQNEVGKIRALDQGQTYVTVRHPKANYSARLLVVCDKQKESDCYISVPTSIITMKPNATAQSITANLVNGTTTDKYSFSWSLDVYDVIDFQYSANVCTITPKQTGSVTITITHPKAAYSQQVIVNVQEYSNFAFPQTSVSMTQGTVTFLNMQVPTTTLTTHVEYSTDNEKICTISGTKNVAQLTGVSAGTTSVHAKLIATSTGIVQATCEMLIYVKEAATDTVYITSNSTITTLNKDKSQTLSATLTGTGITAIDQNNLQWTTKDTDVISITGISSAGTVTGQSIYIKALKPGEALITCSHEKAASDLQFYVVVPGTGNKHVMLNKSYISLVKGSSGTTLKATIENAESNQDYGDLEWSAEKVNGNEIVRIMGNGQTVTVYPVQTGQTTIMAQLPNVNSVAKCTILVEAGKTLTFETNSKKVQPYHSSQVKYKVSPPDAVLTWSLAQDDDYFSYKDLGSDINGEGTVEIIGIKEGAGTLACVTDGSAKGTISVKVDWSYEFNLNTTRISGTPDSVYTLEYTVSPADAKIEVNGNGLSEFTVTNNANGSGKIQVLPHSEGADSIVVKAKNPNDHDKEFGSFNVNANYYYDTLSLSYSVQSDVASQNPLVPAYWSKFQNDAIVLGDGEQLTFMFSVAQKKLKDLKISANLRSRNNPAISLTACAAEGQFILSHSTDITQPAYKIITGYAPTYKGSRSYPDGTPISIYDFYRSGWEDCNWYLDWFVSHYDRWGAEVWNNGPTSTRVYEFYSGSLHESSKTVTKADKSSVNPDWGIVRDPSLDGKCMSVSDFQNSLWYYIPAFDRGFGGECFSSMKHPYGEIDTDHINAVYCDVTPDTTVISSEIVDTLEIIISHNGKTTRLAYPIYLETRNSACTSR